MGWLKPYDMIATSLQCGKCEAEKLACDGINHTNGPKYKSKPRGYGGTIHSERSDKMTKY